MTLVPSRPPAPDSEAHGLTAPFLERPADRVHALACRVLASCYAPTPDNLSFSLDEQFFVLSDVFHELVMINTELHGMDERRGLVFALQAQKQALAAIRIDAKIKEYDARTIEG